MVDPRVLECAAPGKAPGQSNTYERLSKIKAASPQRKVALTCKYPVGDMSAVTLIRTASTLDHSQKGSIIYAQQLEATEATTQETKRLQPLGWEL